MIFGIQDNGLVYLPRQDPGRRHREYKLRVGRNEEGVPCVYFTDRHKMKEQGFPRGGEPPEVEIPLSDFLALVFFQLEMDENEIRATCGLLVG